jgi:small-conductance mechanosensitive channel
LEETLPASASTEIKVVLCIALVTVFLAWSLISRLGIFQRALARHPAMDAVIDLVMFPAAAYGTGRLFEYLFGRSGLDSWQDATRTVTALLITLAIGSGVARLCELWILSQEPRDDSNKLSKLARALLFGFCLFFSVLVFLAMQGYSLTQLSISTGVAAAVVGFAAQQTLGDLFAGIAISFEKPFKMGDWLRFADGTEGEVIDINWRATRLRCWDNTTYVVPNGQLSRSSFINLHGKAHLFAPWYTVQVTGDADPAQVTALLQEAITRCDLPLASPAPVVRLMDGQTQPYTYMVWVHFPNYPAMFAGREQIYKQIHYSLQQAGLQISADIHEIRQRPAAPAQIADPSPRHAAAVLMLPADRPRYDCAVSPCDKLVPVPTSP